MGDLGAFFFEVHNPSIQSESAGKTFFFQVYDLDRSGTLDRAELRKLLEEAYGGPEHMSKFNVCMDIYSYCDVVNICT